MDAHQAETRKEATDTSPISHLVREKMESPCSPSVSFELLKTCGVRKRLSGVKLIERTSVTLCDTSTSQAESIQGIMKIARAKLLEYASENPDIFSIFVNSLNSHSSLSVEDYDDVELAVLLQVSAEMLASHKFDRAEKLISMCEICASPTGNPVQRVVYCFAEALREKLHQETGVNPPGPRKEKTQMNVENFLTCDLPAVTPVEHKIPFTPVLQFSGIQVILDNLPSASRIHLVDLGIKSGSHWTIVMQALTARTEYPVEHLKITAVGTCRERLEMTGERLLSFAQTMKLSFSFSFNIVESDMKELKKDMFELEAGEALAIYSELRLWSMLSCPNRLETLLGVIESIKPRVMVVVEAELNTNQLTFLDRFYEILFSASSYFDCLETCLERDSKLRMVTENVYLRVTIQNIVAAEGEERIHRHEKIDFWRALFARFGLVETELSESSLYQANLVIQQSVRWRDCSLDMNGKCLILKWKSTPMRSLSAWKFQEEEELNRT